MNDNRRDNTHDKKRIKTVFKIVAAAIAVLAAVAFAAEIIAGKLSGDGESSASDPKEYSFFEADYGENILEDEVYLALDRNIAFASHGKEIFLDRETADSLGGAAKMFFDYFPQPFITNINVNDNKYYLKLTMRTLFKMVFGNKAKDKEKVDTNLKVIKYLDSNDKIRIERDSTYFFIIIY